MLPVGLLHISCHIINRKCFVDMMSSRCDSPMDSLYPFGYPGQIEYPMMTTGYDSSEMFDSFGVM